MLDDADVVTIRHANACPCSACAGCTTLAYMADMERKSDMWRQRAATYEAKIRWLERELAAIRHENEILRAQAERAIANRDALLDRVDVDVIAGRSRVASAYSEIE